MGDRALAEENPQFRESVVKTLRERNRLQREIAAAAARLMAEDGAQCAQAKHMAAARLTGQARAAHGILPDNDQVEAALREYLRTFGGAAHAALLLHLRELAVEWMDRLQTYAPHLVGAVLNGSATRHSHVHLNLYTESAKEVEMALLDRGVRIGVDLPTERDLHAQEVIGFVVRAGVRGSRDQSTAILLTIYDPAALRVAPPSRARNADTLLHPIERCGRASLPMMRQLLAETAASAQRPGHLA